MSSLREHLKSLASLRYLWQRCHKLLDKASKLLSFTRILSDQQPGKCEKSVIDSRCFPSYENQGSMSGLHTRRANTKNRSSRAVVLHLTKTKVAKIRREPRGVVRPPATIIRFNQSVVEYGSVPSHEIQRSWPNRRTRQASYIRTVVLRLAKFKGRDPTAEHDKVIYAR